MSEHDEIILDQIRKIDERWGYLRWLDIYALAEELDDECERDKWYKICTRYCHDEEYYAGCM